MTKLNFASDYTLGAHERVLRAINETNFIKTTGYGTDDFCEEARALIRKACGAPKAEIHFISGGTQANLTVIAAFLRSFEAVLCADTGHVNGHEAGAIELTGHKVLTLPHAYGKINAGQIEAFVSAYDADLNHDHMVRPKMVYLSQPTEYGTLYSLEEMTAIKEVCRARGLYLYVDGARLAYALAAPENDVGLSDLSRLCDVFYIGGTKCGTLFGEAVVIPDGGCVPGLFTIVKQHGALLAKGRAMGVQFMELFKDGLYFDIGKPAIDAANKIKKALKEKGYELFFDTPTNQIFVLLPNEKYRELDEKIITGFWERPDENHTVARIATDWGITQADVQNLIELL